MDIEYQTYLSLLLITRLALLRQDGPVSLGFSMALGASQILLVALGFGLSGAALPAIAAIALFTLPGGIAERWVSPLWWRLLSLFGLAVTPALLQPLVGELAFSDAALRTGDLADGLGALMVGAERWESARILSPLLAVLVLANEANIAMRVVLGACGLVPRRPPGDTDSQAETDTREFNAGRVIGILERWLMFAVIAYAGDWSALGFIIAAKGLVRFNKLQDPIFAEYLLVGTLLSTLFAIVVAAWLG
ncbi:hypothetical protein [Parahaliea mediterranea]|uniref:Uncharacterized protein n=1 Tax=Parahaliea mediterranea TaxID=651086 RepID=A0A939DGB7_9GAMM|nr:hypothetical protein [Parahaliea mediterranea]MBN7797548.1 hypothetical protein [Parahaliea mediterranea]